MAQPSELFATRIRDVKTADALCEIARPLIQAKAKRLVRRPGFTSSDQDDVEQEVLLRLLERFATTPDGDLPVVVFIGTVLKQSLATQLRDRLAKKRDPRRTRSLDVASQPRVGDRDDKRKAARREPSDLIDMGLDVSEEIERLSNDYQQLCRNLGIESISELARRLGTPRRTLRDRIRAVRRQFENHGLRDYVA